MEPEPTKIPLCNPLSEEFSATYLNDKNEPEELVMPGLTVTYFDPPRARFMKKHLADAVMDKTTVKTNYEDTRKEVLKTIEVAI